jgi:hypothetical protein
MPIHRLWLCFHSSSFSLQVFQDPSQQLLRPDKGQSLACCQHKTGSPQLKPPLPEGESWGDGGALATYDECPNSGHTEESPGAEEPKQLPHPRSIYPPHHQASCLSGSLAGWSTGTPSLDIAMLHPLLLSQPGLGGHGFAQPPTNSFSGSPRLPRDCRECPPCRYSTWRNAPSGQQGNKLMLLETCGCTGPCFQNSSPKSTPDPPHTHRRSLSSSAPTETRACHTY